LKRYAPKEHENIGIDYDSSDEDLMSHISTKQDLNLNELELFLNTKRALALDNILDWWKVCLMSNF
jgi:hypothetical protein